MPILMDWQRRIYAFTNIRIEKKCARGVKFLCDRKTIFDFLDHSLPIKSSDSNELIFPCYLKCVLYWDTCLIVTFEFFTWQIANITYTIHGRWKHKECEPAKKFDWTHSIWMVLPQYFGFSHWVLNSTEAIHECRLDSNGCETSFIATLNKIYNFYRH